MYNSGYMYVCIILRYINIKYTVPVKHFHFFVKYTFVPGTFGTAAVLF